MVMEPGVWVCLFLGLAHIRILRHHINTLTRTTESGKGLFGLYPQIARLLPLCFRVSRRAQSLAQPAMCKLPSSSPPSDCTAE